MSVSVPPPPAEFPATGTSRRGLLRLAALGIAGAASGPVLAGPAAGFTHGVASGEPGPARVLLWTRFVAANAEARLTWELSENADFARIAASGEAVASPARDWCAKAWAEGLKPGAWYYYRFTAPSGEQSVTGRTRTLPVGKVPAFRLAVFSCSNYGFGWFNAYAHAAEAGEFDLAVHLGDYFYEYRNGEYPDPGEGLAERPLPVAEAVTLEHYRERFRTYRADPDLQRIHQVLPMIAVWDDHETANDTWKDGAENHQSESEGDWAPRKAASERAYREWMPVSDDNYAAYEIGDLATLLRIETRHIARDRPLDLSGVMRGKQGAELDAALAAFRDGAWRDPGRTLMGAGQERWLAAALKSSVRQGKRWQVLVQQVIMADFQVGPQVLEGVTARVPEAMRRVLAAANKTRQAGLPFSMDTWSGYPAARERLYRDSLEAGADLVVLTGDSHNAWAFDHALGRERVGVEMAGHSVTSPGFEHYVDWMTPADTARALISGSPQLRWCDTAQRGYMAVALTPKAATSEWRFLASVRTKGAALAGTRRMTVLHGQRRFGND